MRKFGVTFPVRHLVLRGLLKGYISHYTRCSVSRYMKYLYPHECQREGLSTPADLQAAIDGNRREGRRVGYSAASYPDFTQRAPLIARYGRTSGAADRCRFLDPLPCALKAGHHLNVGCSYLCRSFVP